MRRRQADGSPESKRQKLNHTIITQNNHGTKVSLVVGEPSEKLKFSLDNLAELLSDPSKAEGKFANCSMDEGLSISVKSNAEFEKLLDVLGKKSYVNTIEVVVEDNELARELTPHIMALGSSEDDSTSDSVLGSDDFTSEGGEEDEPQLEDDSDEEQDSGLSILE